MKRGTLVLLLGLLGLLLTCTSGQAPEEVARDEKSAAPAAGRIAGPLAVLPPSGGTSRQESDAGAPAEPAPTAEKRHEAASGKVTTKVYSGQTAPPAIPPAAANGGPAASAHERWQKFTAIFITASYTFNPPSPIKVDHPRTIHLWVDTTTNHRALAGELKKMVPADASRVESGSIQVSPVVQATLTGKNFTITPNSPEQQTINLAGRTIWSWEITPTWPGLQTLHLRLIAVPPPGIASDPYTIPVPLDREITVEVTTWWLIDHFFDRYWKWLLGGLGTLLLAGLGWWWKKKR